MSSYGYRVVLDVTAARKGEGSIVVFPPGFGFRPQSYVEVADSGLTWELATDLADDIAEAANTAKDMAPIAEDDPPPRPSPTTPKDQR